MDTHISSTTASKATPFSQHTRMVVFTAPSSGTGLSTLAAMFALETSNGGLRTALIDLDVHAGGLDVILGIEGESGLRMSEVSAPLGHLSGSALCAELPQWEGIAVLGADPWNGPIPNTWELQAVIEALAQLHEVIVMDAGQGAAVKQLGLDDHTKIVILVEMSVLGMARAKSHIAEMIQCFGKQNLYIVGTHPAIAGRRCAKMSIADANAYLQVIMLGALVPNRRLAVAVIQGLGISQTPKAYQSLLSTLVREVVDVPRRSSRTRRHMRSQTR